MATILLIEDSDLCALVFRRALERAGFAVVVATTVCDALHKVATQTFDAALVDAQLPDGDGMSVPLPCPRVMMSADARPGVITKSSDLGSLVAAVRRAVAGAASGSVSSSGAGSRPGSGPVAVAPEGRRGPVAPSLP